MASVQIFDSIASLRRAAGGRIVRENGGAIELQDRQNKSVFHKVGGMRENGSVIVVWGYL